MRFIVHPAPSSASMLFCPLMSGKGGECVVDGLVLSSRSFYSSLFYSCKLNETELARGAKNRP